MAHFGVFQNNQKRTNAHFSLRFRGQSNVSYLLFLKRALINMEEFKSKTELQLHLYIKPCISQAWCKPSSNYILYNCSMVLSGFQFQGSRSSILLTVLAGSLSSTSAK